MDSWDEIERRIKDLTEPKKSAKKEPEADDMDGLFESNDDNEEDVQEVYEDEFGPCDIL